jgi:hypothetical protein
LAGAATAIVADTIAAATAIAAATVVDTVAPDTAEVATAEATLAADTAAAVVAHTAVAAAVASVAAAAASVVAVVAASTAAEVMAAVEDIAKPHPPTISKRLPNQAAVFSSARRSIPRRHAPSIIPHPSPDEIDLPFLQNLRYDDPPESSVSFLRFAA